MFNIPPHTQEDNADYKKDDSIPCNTNPCAMRPVAPPVVRREGPKHFLEWNMEGVPNPATHLIFKGISTELYRVVTEQTNEWRPFLVVLCPYHVI